jgi:hypothetical protein
VINMLIVPVLYCWREESRERGRLKTEKLKV